MVCLIACAKLNSICRYCAVEWNCLWNYFIVIYILWVLCKQFKWLKRLTAQRELAWLRKCLLRYSNECLCLKDKMMIIIRMDRIDGAIFISLYHVQLRVIEFPELNSNTECLWLRNKSYFDIHLLKRCQWGIYIVAPQCRVFCISFSHGHVLSDIDIRLPYLLSGRFSVVSVSFLLRLFLVVSITLNSPWALAMIPFYSQPVYPASLSLCSKV